MCNVFIRRSQFARPAALDGGRTIVADYGDFGARPRRLRFTYEEGSRREARRTGAGMVRGICDDAVQTLFDNPRSVADLARGLLRADLGGELD